MEKKHPPSTAVGVPRSHDAAKYKRMNSSLSKLTRCFLKFGPDSDKNIDVITRTAGEILDGACVMYNRIEGDSFHTASSWGAPSDMPLSGKAKGHVCFDVVSGTRKKAFIVRNLDKSRYAASDPNIRKYRLKTYVGYPVEAAGKTVGALCTVYPTDARLASDGIEILSILAQALGIEEQRKLAEERLKDSEAKYSAIINASQDIIYTINLDGRITYISRQVRAYGYSPKELIGRHIREFAHPDDRYFIDQAFSRTLKTGEILPIISYRIKKKDGAYFRAEQKSGLLTKDGRPFMVSGIIRDVTERDELRDRIVKNEETLRMIFDTATDAIFIKDLKDRYVQMNKTCARMLHVSPQQALGKTNHGIFSEKDIESSRQENLKVLKTGEPLFVNKEMVIAGKHYFLHTAKTPLKDVNGAIIGILGITRDITELKKMEAELVRVKAIEAVNKIARPAAHDFNNILAAINGYATLIMETMKTGNPARPEIAQILNAVKRAAAVTDRLQTYGRETEKE